MRGPALALFVALAGPAAAGEADPILPRFFDDTAAARIAHVYAGDYEYMVGGGVAVFDCDDDGFSDLFLAGGADPARLYRNLSERGGPLRFAAEPSGLEVEAVTGAYPLDIDSDGIADLVLLRVGENLAMRGLGGCRFERANEAWGFAGGDAWSTALAATFEPGAAWPTIAIGNYIDRSEELSPWGSCTDNWLHRPMIAHNARVPQFAPPLPLRPSHCALSMLFTDWNRSGLPSLRISNDREYYEGGEEQLWRIEPGAPPALWTAAEGWKLLRIWGMGIAGADLDADGFPEYFLTSMADNKLQRLVALPPDGEAARPTYADVALALGVTAHRPYAGGDVHPSTAWHAEFADVNNDGRLDLFVAKGNVAEMPDFAAKDPNNLLVQTAEGTFVETGEAAGIATFGVSRGAALADFNLDGLLDLIVVNRWSNAELWRNVTEGAGKAAAVRLRQPAGMANRDAIGAWVEVLTAEGLQRREVTVGGGHAGGQLGWLHFGLGEGAEAELRVLWPGGEAGPWFPVRAGGFYLLERGGAPVPFFATD